MLITQVTYLLQHSVFTRSVQKGEGEQPLYRHGGHEL